MENPVSEFTAWDAVALQEMRLDCAWLFAGQPSQLDCLAVPGATIRCREWGNAETNKKAAVAAFFDYLRCAYWMTISTRRFCGSRTLSPVGTSSWVSPLPMTVIACAGTPSRTRASLTALARRSDSAML